MRRFILLIIALATLLPSLAQAYDVLVLQSRRDPAYDEVLKGFSAGRDFSQRVVVLSDYAEVDVTRIVREEHPSLILAVGDTALKAARPVRQTPILAVMALAINTATKSQPNLTGISMFSQPERYLATFKAMKARRVGIIHNPAKCDWYLQQARRAANQMGIELVVREVSAPRETLAQLNTLAGKIDGLWMLPDSTAVTRETAEAWFRFSQEQSIPLVSFANAYLGLGAAAVVDIDRAELGRQTGVMATRILSGGGRSNEIEFPRQQAIKANNSVLNRLGIDSAPLEKLSH